MTYYAKLLLLGEHTIINSSNALAIPFRRFSGQWKWMTGEDSPAAAQQQLTAFAKYLDQMPSSGEMPAIDIARFSRELSEGLYFDSDIPRGYGLGSSGALCAAVYDRYAREKISRGQIEKYPILKNQLATMESFFHGSSSGTDPLICYLERPVLLLRGGQLEQVMLPSAPSDGSYRFFLLDTGITRKTGPLVQIFLKKYEAPAYASRINSRLAPQVNGAIQNLLAGQWTDLFGRMAAISRLQLELMPEMIPVDFRKVWQEGLESDVYKLKLCGAGGGGFLLGYTNDYERTSTFLETKGMAVMECPVSR